MKLLRLLLAFTLLLTLLRAQGATGTLEGRVQNPATGTYLEGARVSVEGTALTAFTDDAGRFLLPGVPAGAVPRAASALALLSRASMRAARSG
jgi:hypothetical protein